MPGKLDQGSYDFPFSFKNIDLEIDTYIGVGLSVEYSVSAQMFYAGSMMKYTCKQKEPFAVKNYLKPASEVARMGVTLSMQSPAASVKLHIDQTELNCETEWISGWIQGKHARRPEVIKALKLELLQRETHGYLKPNEHPPYKLRVLADYELCDGFVIKEKIPFRVPLRGLVTPYLSPTYLNVFNKFSVQYFVRVKVVVLRQQLDMEAASDGKADQWLTVEAECLGEQ